MTAKFILVFITSPSKKEGQHIVSELMDRHLVACGNILEGVDSIFTWKGKIERANEVFVILKTKRAMFKEIVYVVEKIHSYEVPEIIALPIMDGSKEYLKWIDESVY